MDVEHLPIRTLSQKIAKIPCQKNFAAFAPVQSLSKGLCVRTVQSAIAHYNF
jgi:hypothetical protein